MKPDCPSENVLLQWIAGRLAPERLLEVEAHLDVCEICRELLRQEDGAPRENLLPLERGAAVGRYLILDVIGQGGMGIVYAARDPELDRQVALKLLRTGAPNARGCDEHVQARLRREAQAMARLSHPNVVTVFDVGVANGQLFIAMEQIEGTTLASARDEARPLDETLKQLIAAGRGLEAAHAAGFVHRDFKPANVLVGRDGRVCVSDFGLARLEAAPAREPSSPAMPTPPAALVSEAGMLIGTPQYMAPEQLRGETADARSDQFSFCVALYEALYGERPFSGSTLAELRANVQAGDVRRPPRAARVPRTLRQVLLRGLRVDPVERYPSMTALLHDLERYARARRRSAWLVVAGLGGALTLGVVSAQALLQRRPSCHDAADRLAGIWDARARTQIHAAFSRTGSSAAEDAWRTVERSLDGFASAWVRTRSEACEATQVRGEQSAELYRLRIDCLDQALDETAALLSLFAQADAELVAQAAQAVQGADHSGSCANVRALRQRRGPPVDPVARAAYETLRHKLARMSALIRVGRFADGNQTITALGEEARRVAHPLLLSDAFRFRGLIELERGEALAAERSFHDAAAAAEQGADDARAALAWDALALACAQEGHLEDAALWLDHAAAAGQRAGDDPALAASHRRCVLLVAARRRRVP